MKQHITLFILLFTTTLFCPEQQDNNSKSPYSYYQKGKALRHQSKKILLARNSYIASQAAITGLLIASSSRIPPAKTLAKSAVINYTFYNLTK